MHSTKTLLIVAALALAIGASITWIYWSYRHNGTLELFAVLDMQEQMIQHHSMYLNISSGNPNIAAEFLETLIESNCAAINENAIYSDLFGHVQDVQETTELCD